MVMEGSLRVIAITLTLFLWLLTIHPNFSTSESKVRCIESERQALLMFKQDLKDPSNRLASWTAAADEDCCDWAGVLCHNRTGHVLQLRLRTFRPLYDDLRTDLEWQTQYKVYQRSRFGGIRLSA